MVLNGMGLAGNGITEMIQATMQRTTTSTRSDRSIL